MFTKYAEWEFPVLKMSMDVSKDYRIGLLKTERGKRRKNIEMNVESYFFSLIIMV